jgi:hypothetical protein
VPRLPEREAGCEGSAPAPCGGLDWGGSSAVAGLARRWRRGVQAGTATLQLLEAEIGIARLALELHLELRHLIVELFNAARQLAHLIGEITETLLGLQPALGRRGYGHQNREHDGRGCREEKS